MQARKTLRGFTLIELLVVVAVLAVLAAIAVPNFLEAMTRSKVSRVKADMRSLSTALEAFRVDTNRYPSDATEGIRLYIERFAVLTTPVAYITSIPADPFADRAKILEYCATKDFNPYVDPQGSQNFINPMVYDYAARRSADGSVQDRATWERFTWEPDAVQWAIRSCGPDRTPTWLGDPEPAYDPTNGTVSRGNIYWSGPGKGEDRPRVE